MTGTSTINANTPAPLLMYDGECGFCNRTVRFVMDNEASPVLRFAPVQGETARRLLANAGLPADIGQKTIIYWDGQKFTVRSRAAADVMRLMGGKWTSRGQALGLIPAPLADLGYRLVARLRKRIPVDGSCAVPTPEQRARFLD